MAAFNEVLGLTVDVTAKTDGFVKALEAAAAKAKLNPDITGPMVEKFKDAQKAIKTIFAKTVEDAAVAGLGRAKLDKFVGKLQPLTDNIESSMKRIFQAEITLKRKGLKEEKKKRTEAFLAEERQKLQGLQSRLKVENREANKIIKRRQAAVEEAERLASRAFSEAAEEAGESLQKTFEDLKSGNVGGIAKGMGKRVGAFGAKWEEKGQAKGGMMGGLQAGIGSLLSKIGPALMAIGALAAGFAAVVAVALQADAAVKDLNRTLLSAGGAGLDLAGQFREVGSVMTRVSRGFMESFEFNHIWGTTAKDHLEILGAYAEAGITFKKMAEGVKNAGEEMERLKKYTEAALTYSKLLGLSTKEISEAMGEYMMDLGFALEGIQGKFANISRAAMESGFSTKRFFNMVLQATSGMSMYNVRLEETAGLLLQLTKVLGQKMGGEFLQGVTKGFKDEDTLTRTKKTMTTGVGYSLAVLRKDAMKTADEFTSKLEGVARENAEAAKGFKAVMEEFGLATGGQPLDAKAMLEKMGSMSDAQRSELMAKTSAKDPALGRMLSHMARQSVVMKKGAGLGEAQYARGEAGGSAAMLLQMNELKAVTGKRIDQIHRGAITQQAAFEQITGKSGEEFRKWAEVAENYAGRQKGLADAQAEIERLKAAGDEDAAAAYARQFNEEFGKQWGIYLGDAGDQLGKRFTAMLDTTGRVDEYATFQGKALGDTFEDMVMGTGEGFIGKEDDKVAEDIMLAQEIASNTADLATILQQGVEWLLSQIYTSVEWIGTLLGKDKFSKEEMTAKQEAQNIIQEKQRSARDEIVRQSKEIQKLELEAKSGKTTPERQKEIKALIEGRQTAVDKLQARSQALSATAASVTRMTPEEAHKYQEEVQTGAGMIGVSMAQENVQKVLKPLLEKYDPGVGSRAAMAKATAQQEALGKTGGFEEGAGKVFWWMEDERQRLGQEMAAQASEKEYGKSAAGVLGLPMAFRGVTPDWLTASYTDLVANRSAGSTGGALVSDEDFVGEKVYLGGQKEQEKLAKARERRTMTTEEKQKEAQTKQLVEGIQKITEEGEVRQLATKMAELGFSGSAESLRAQAELLRKGTALPRGADLNAMVGDTGKSIAQTLLASGLAGTGGNQALNRFISKKSADDFLMHIGSDGQVKFAQRIDGADTVALASKGGGAVSSAAGKAGGGGVTIVQHNYSNMEAVQKGWRTLMAARAIR